MVRNEGRLISPGEPLPHGRGDGPIEGTRILATRPSSPRAWGWSALHGEATAAGILFPTGVGMVRMALQSIGEILPLPHGRGDGPRLVRSWTPQMSSSPRAWGWSVVEPKSPKMKNLFPTGVGMVRSPISTRLLLSSLPHGRGDGPYFALDPPIGPSSSPRAWGWSDSGEIVHVNHRLFPTGVGMVRLVAVVPRTSVPLPHGRGDGPPSLSPYSLRLPSSPRAWGWSAN